jgi:hypothetical protein
MATIIVQNNQTIWDIALQEYGSADAVKQLIIDNPAVCDFNNDLLPGTKLIITESAIIDNDTVTYLRKKGIKPSTQQL